MGGYKKFSAIEFTIPYLVLIEANIDTHMLYEWAAVFDPYNTFRIQKDIYLPTYLKMTIGLFYNSLNNVHCRQSNADFASCLDKMQNDDANGFYIRVPIFPSICQHSHFG